MTGAAAFLPAPWRLGWQTEIAGLVQVPLRPFTHLGNALAGWLRPPASPAAGVPDGARELVESLMADRDLAQRRYLVARDQVRELEARIRDLQALPAAAREAERVIRLAHVTRRSAESMDAPVEVMLPRDSRGGIHARAIAVHRGVHLLGRLTGETSGAVLTLLPILNPGTGYLQVRLGERPDAEPDPQRRGQIHPTGDGRTLVGVVVREAPVAVGDVVYLDDPGWPATAQFMTVGRVSLIEPDPDEILRNLV